MNTYSTNQKLLHTTLFLQKTTAKIFTLRNTRMCVSKIVKKIKKNEKIFQKSLDFDMVCKYTSIAFLKRNA